MIYTNKKDKIKLIKYKKISFKIYIVFRRAKFNNKYTVKLNKFTINI